MSKAKLVELEQLHKKVSTYYMDTLDADEDISSGTLNAINTFLKQNEVVVDRLKDASMDSLTEKFQELIDKKERE